GGEFLAFGRIVDDAVLQAAAVAKRDRNRVVGNAVDEVGGAIEGIDDPLAVGIAPGLNAAFLANKGMVRIGAAQLFDDEFFRGVVYFGDEIVLALGVDAHPVDAAA